MITTGLFVIIGLDYWSNFLAFNHADLTFGCDYTFWIVCIGFKDARPVTAMVKMKITLDSIPSLTEK